MLTRASAASSASPVCSKVPSTKRERWSSPTRRARASAAASPAREGSTPTSDAPDCWASQRPGPPAPQARSTSRAPAPTARAGRSRRASLRVRKPMWANSAGNRRSRRWHARSVRRSRHVRARPRRRRSRRARRGTRRWRSRRRRVKPQSAGRRDRRRHSPGLLCRVLSSRAKELCEVISPHRHDVAQPRDAMSPGPCSARMRRRSRPDFPKKWRRRWSSCPATWGRRSTSAGARSFPGRADDVIRIALGSRGSSIAQTRGLTRTGMEPSRPCLWFGGSPGCGFPRSEDHPEAHGHAEQLLVVPTSTPDQRARAWPADRHRMPVEGLARLCRLAPGLGASPSGSIRGEEPRPCPAHPATGPRASHGRNSPCRASGSLPARSLRLG